MYTNGPLHPVTSPSCRVTSTCFSLRRFGPKERQRTANTVEQSDVIIPRFMEVCKVLRDNGAVAATGHRIGNVSRYSG